MKYLIGSKVTLKSENLDNPIGIVKKKLSPTPPHFTQTRYIIYWTDIKKEMGHSEEYLDRFTVKKPYLIQSYVL